MSARVWMFACICVEQEDTGYSLCQSPRQHSHFPADYTVVLSTVDEFIHLHLSPLSVCEENRNTQRRPNADFVEKPRT